MSVQQDHVVPEEYKNHVAPGKDWKEIVAWVSDLPPLPHVASQALGLIEDPDTTAGKLTQLLGQDAALAARVLKIANSAMFSRQREISTINQAIMTIGFKTLKGIIVAATLRQVNRKFGPIEQMIWQNSTCTSIASRIIATHLKKPYVEEVFLFGLLHDLGKLVLMRQIPKEYEEVVNHSKSGELFFHEAEQKEFGFSHPLIGALVVKKWNFSPDTCQLILHHHDNLPSSVETPLQEMMFVGMLGDVFSHELGYGHLEGYKSLDREKHLLTKLLGLNSEDLPELMDKTKEMFSEIGSVFS